MKGMLGWLLVVSQACVYFLLEQSHLWGAKKKKTECCLLPLSTAPMKKGRVSRQRNTFHIFMRKEKRIYPSPCPHLHLILYHPTFPLSPTLQRKPSGMVYIGFFFPPNTYHQKACEPAATSWKLFFCHSQNVPQLSELRHRPNTCKTCTRQPICQSPHGLLRPCIHSILFNWH